jgi:hypothetical protein
MEKRWSERRKLEVGVDVYQEGELLGSCSSHDIGLGGTFLASSCAEHMPKDSEVDLVFHLPSEGVSKRHNVHAKVTRVTDGGIGLKFCGFDTGVFRSLQELMAYAKSNSVQNQQQKHISH